MGFRPLALVLALILALSTVAIVGTASPASAVAPTISVSITGNGQVLAGENATYTITATNTGATDGYNLALYADVPVGVLFASSTSLGAPVVYAAGSLGVGVPAAGFERWVWEDVSDLPASGAFSGSFTVTPSQPPLGTGETLDTEVFPPGSTYSIDGFAALSGDATYLPVFSGSTGVGGATAIAETGLAGPSTRSTQVISLELRKSEPSPEAELLRGIHDQTTIYTITVRGTNRGDHEDAVLVDYLPAGLEFLGCGVTDNSTVDRDLLDPTINEYFGAAALTGTPLIATNCPEPETVTTIVADASHVADYNLTLGAVYTEVIWNLGTIPLGTTTTVRYAAGIPLYENTMTWDGVGGAPTPASLDQTANLDNNNGPSTRHGDLSTHVDGDTWTNVVGVAADFQGVIRTGGNRAIELTASETVHAMDLAILKSIAPGDSTFDVDNISDFTLTLRASEYMDSSQIVVTDVMSNGLCPVLPGGTTWINISGLDITDCTSLTGSVSGADVVSAEAFADGTFEVIFRPTSLAFPDPDDFVLSANDTHAITYGVLNRGDYELAPSEYGPTTSGDGFGNTVSFTAVTDAIDPLLATFPDTLLVWDDSGATMGTDLTTISKRVMPRDEVEQDLAPGVDPCTDGTFSSNEEADFRMGDTVCFELRVNFPNSVDVRNPIVTDFLPNGLVYEGHDVVAGSAPIDIETVDAAAGRIDWLLGTVGDGGDRYVTRGSVFVAHVWATVVAPSNGPILDKPENLMKYRQQNVSGTLYFLRSEASVLVDPEISLVKGVLEVTDNASAVSSTRSANSQDNADGTVFGSNRDGIMVRENETVTYRIDLYGVTYPAVDAVVWDALPEGIVADDVTFISDLGQAYDPLDIGYPAGLDPVYAGRSVIVWTGIDINYILAADESQKTLTYDVLIPVGTAVSTTLDNEASIIQYASGINTSTDDDAQVYYPANSLDVSKTDDWNTDGEGTRDGSDVYLPSASISKSVTSPVDTNNTTGQLVHGEVAHYTYTVTIPAYTSVVSGVLSDALPNFSTHWTAEPSLTQVDYPGGSTAAGDAAFSIGPDNFTVNTANGTLTFPALYTNDTASSQTFTVHFYAAVKATATSGTAWNHSTSTNRTNTARFTSGTASDITATASVQIREPNPSIAKLVDDDTVEAGQTVTYTLTANNATGRPTAYDTVVVDCVPSELGGVTLGVPTQGSASIVSDASCTGTRIVWEVGAVVANTSRTLQYTATVSPASAGGATYVNEVGLTAYGLDDETADRRTYPRSTTESITVIGSAITKTVDEPIARVGEIRDFTITTTLPANVNFYDAAIIDNVPAGMSIDTATITCTEPGPVACASAPGGDLSELTQSGTLHGWWLGDILSSPVVRTITVTYSGTVLDVPGNVDGFDIVNTAALRWNINNVLDDATQKPASANYTPGQTTTNATATVEVVEPDLEITKTVNMLDSDTVDPGETFTYRINVDNAGTSDGYNVTVVDTIPTGVVVNEASITASGVLAGENPITGGGTITWTIPSVAAYDAGVELSYTAVLAPSSTLTAASLTNDVEVTQYFSHPTGAGFDDDERREYSGPDADAVVTPQFPDPVITKTPTGTTAYIGENHTFTIVVTNDGNGPAEGMVITDVLPAGWLYVNNSADMSVGADLNPTIVGQTLTWDDLVDLAPSASLTITYQAVPNPTHDWDDTNTGSTFDHTNDVDVTVNDTSGAPGNLDGTYEDDTDASVQIHRANLLLTKAVNGGQEYLEPVAGAELEYLISILNQGPDTSVGDIVIVDELPADATYVGATSTSSDWSFSYDAVDHELTATFSGTVASGATIPGIVVTVDFEPDLAEGTTIRNDVCITEVRTFDDLASGARYCDFVQQSSVRIADVTIDKTTTTVTYVAGEFITWDIVVSNDGPSISASPITVVDTLPAGLHWSEHLTWQTIPDTGGNWGCVLEIVDSALTGNLICTWNGADLQPGDSLPTLELTGRIRASWTSTIYNEAEVFPTTTDSDLTNNEDDAITPGVDTEADLTLLKTIVTPDAAPGEGLPAGETGRYRFTIENLGPSDAIAVVTEDELPAGLTFAGNVTSQSGDTWACVGDGNDPELVECELTSNSTVLPEGESTWYEFDVEIAPNVTGTITNEATVSSDTFDPNLDNNTDDVSAAAYIQTDLALLKTRIDSVADQVYRVGDEVRFTLMVTNNGPADAADVEIVDTIPTGLTYDRVESATGWETPVLVGDELTIELTAPLAFDDSVSIDVIFVITEDAVNGSLYPSVVTNGAEVFTSSEDTDATNNDDDADVTVHSPDLEIVKDASVTITEGGETFTYTLTVTNVDEFAFADDVTVTDDIPFDLALLTDVDDIGGVDWDCTLTGADGDGYGGTLECVLDTLAPDTTATPITFEVRVLPGVSRSTIPNSAEVASPDEHDDFVDEFNEDDFNVAIRWIEVVTGLPSCLIEAPYLDYDLTIHNVDTSVHPVTFTWFADDGAGNPTGPPIAVFTIEPGEPLSGRTLWPGAEVDEFGAGIAWPGMRPVIPGSTEVPTFENLIEDPTLDTFPLRAGAVVVIQANPETTIVLDYPLPTADCFIDRDPYLSILKEASGTTFHRGQTVVYTIGIANIDYGATDDVTLTDPVHPNLKVESVVPDLSTDPTIADWGTCTVTGQDADGFGGMIECPLDGWLGHGQTAPNVVVTATFRGNASLGDLPNVATASWTDPDGVLIGVLSVDDPAVVTLVLSAAEILALTGFGSQSMLWWAIILLILGSGLTYISRRREEREANAS
ncbi:MAG: hypothetical protein CVT64_01720 [Actinobacteria bacterium HGW-Actinobacteria-4]|nr:MAG: hypothetical protein CVT64_01720 [Actinobacteria bacterium HGW-Actinobacteria-4]